nr:399_t:CDS:2 [Entrophospora candida]
MSTNIGNIRTLSISVEIEIVNNNKIFYYRGVVKEDDTYANFLKKLDEQFDEKTYNITSVKVHNNYKGVWETVNHKKKLSSAFDININSIKFCLEKKRYDKIVKPNNSDSNNSKPNKEVSTRSTSPPPPSPSIDDDVTPSEMPKEIKLDESPQNNNTSELPNTNLLNDTKSTEANNQPIGDPPTIHKNINKIDCSGSKRRMDSEDGEHLKYIKLT